MTVYEQMIFKNIEHMVLWQKKKKGHIENQSLRVRVGVHLVVQKVRNDVGEILKTSPQPHSSSVKTHPLESVHPCVSPLSPWMEQVHNTERTAYQLTSSPGKKAEATAWEP